MRCAECGAPVAEVTLACAECGAPPVGKRAAATSPAASSRGDNTETPRVTVTDAWSPPAWIRRGRRCFAAALVFCLVVYMIGVVALNETPDTGLHPAIGWVVFFSIAGALLALILFEIARNQFRPRQVVWALVPIVSVGLLAFVPFLWLALIRRRVTDWVVFAAYLAAAVAELYFNVVGLSDSALASNGFVVEAGLVVIAPVHAVVAFSPAAGVSSWRDARAARVAGQRQPPVIDAGTQDWQQNAGSDHWKQPDSGSGGVRAH